MVAETKLSYYGGDDEDDDVIAAAYLHDVVEDHAGAGYTPEYLRSRGINERVLNIVDHVTKSDGEDYYNFIMRILDNQDAIVVKLSDLQHNLSTVPEGNLKQKYLLARQVLWTGLQ